MTISQDATDQAVSMSANDPFWQQAFETLMASYPEPVFVIDGEGQIIGWNDRMVDLLGYTADEVLGKQAYDVFGTEGESETLAETVARKGEPIRETRIRTAEDVDGNKFHSRALAVPIPDSEGAVTAVVEVISSVTDLIETQHQMEQVQKEVSENIETRISELRERAEDIHENVTRAVDQASAQDERISQLREEVDSFTATVEEIASSSDQVNKRIDDAVQGNAGPGQHCGGTCLDTRGDVSRDGSDQRGHVFRPRSQRTPDGTGRRDVRVYRTPQGGHHVCVTATRCPGRYRSSGALVLGNFELLSGGTVLESVPRHRRWQFFLLDDDVIEIVEWLHDSRGIVLQCDPAGSHRRVGRVDGLRGLKPSRLDPGNSPSGDSACSNRDDTRAGSTKGISHAPTKPEVPSTAQSPFRMPARHEQPKRYS